MDPTLISPLTKGTTLNISVKQWLTSGDMVTSTTMGLFDLSELLAQGLWTLHSTSASHAAGLAWASRRQIYQHALGVVIMTKSRGSDPDP